jgi:glyoxylase-like metal-dependent hydrolase (beta-lactamase superfamily II)
MVEIDVVQVGVLATNCYVVRSTGESECMVIDPGGESARIIEFLDTLQLTPSVVVSTHAHADHTGAVAPLVERYGSKFMIGAGDVVAATEQLDWLKSMLGDFQEPPAASQSLDHDDVISVSGLEVTALSTPGHTRGSTSLYVEGNVFTGDTLFRETIGRFDLSDGDEQQEIASIKNILFALDDDTIVLPGHGVSTTVGHERVANRYVR